VLRFGPKLTSSDGMLGFMIERHYGQRPIAEDFFNEPIEDWWEPWMKKADEILDDEELINISAFY